MCAGPRAPHPPQNVAVIAISGNRATIQWTVPSIAYTPETYVVEYGTSQDSLNLTSYPQKSGPDIIITDVTYSVQLSNLEPATNYQYQVVATNTADKSVSGVQSFRTGDSCELYSTDISGCKRLVSFIAFQIQSSGVSVVGHNYTMACTVHLPCDQQLSGLRWRNSTGHTLNTSTGGHVTTLGLHFQPLRMSDGGQYTCVAEYDGGGSRQTSEVALFTGNLIY